jgi:cobaltochelatase CobN
MDLFNLRKQDAELLTDVKTWLAVELNSREWNPEWLKAMQSSGYCSAR